MKRNFSINDYINMLLAHLRLIIILPFIGAVLSYCYTVFLVTPLYSTSMLLYVKNTDAASPTSAADNQIIDNGSNNSQISSNTKVSPYNMNASAQIVQTCSLLFKTTKFMQVVLNDPSLELINNYSANSLKSSVIFESVNETQVMSVTISSSNAEDTAQILNAIARQAEEYYKNYFPTGQIFLAEEPPTPKTPVSPNLGTNVMYGFVGGLCVAVGIALLTGFIDTTVKPNDDLYKMYKIPVFAEILGNG